MASLFDQTKIKSLTLRNRFVRSATVDNGAVDGCPSDGQIALFEDLARGGVALIFTGMTCVEPTDQTMPTQNCLFDDRFIPGFRRLTDAVHRVGGKVAAQLAYSGRQRGQFLKDEKDSAVTPSIAPDDPFYQQGRYRIMTEEEIRRAIEAFGAAAGRAREAGFDAVQVHGAHPFLLAQFLSPYCNRRDDSWGGPLENRVRIHREILMSIRRSVGQDFPVMIKLGVQDGFSGGLELPEGCRAAVILSERGFDALEISQGLRGKRYEETEFRIIRSARDEAYFRQWCAEVKKHVNVPVMMIGGMRSLPMMEEVVRKGEADYISLCRPFVREPELVNLWKRDNGYKAKCISCNTCIEVFPQGRLLYCPLREREASAKD